MHTYNFHRDIFDYKNKKCIEVGLEKLLQNLFITTPPFFFIAFVPIICSRRASAKNIFMSTLVLLNCKKLLLLNCRTAKLMNKTEADFPTIFSLMLYQLFRRKQVGYRDQFYSANRDKCSLRTRVQKHSLCIVFILLQIKFCEYKWIKLYIICVYIFL